MGLDGAADGGHAGAVELLVIGVPVFGHTGLGLDLAAGLLGLQVLETVLALGAKLVLPSTEGLLPFVQLGK